MKSNQKKIDFIVDWHPQRTCWPFYQSPQWLDVGLNYYLFGI